MRNNPLYGARQELTGLRLLLRPGLKRYLLMPLSINVLVFGVVGWIGYTQFGQALERFLPESSWLYYFRWILWPLFALSFLMIVFYTFTVVANLLAAPFNSRLAARVEALLTGQAPPDGGSIAAEIVPAITMELRKLLYFLLRAVPLLLLFLVPGLNLAAPFLWFAFSAWFLTVQYMDYPMGNHGLRLREQFAELRRARLTALGFGAALTLLMMVPVLNFTAMPAAVAGATALWCDRKGR